MSPSPTQLFSRRSDGRDSPRSPSGTGASAPGQPGVARARAAATCLRAWSAGDYDAARTLLSDDATFESPLGARPGLAGVAPEGAAVADRVTGIALRKTVVDGDDVCILFDLVAEPDGALPAVGWYHFRDDKIDSVRTYFDPRRLELSPPATQGRDTGAPPMATLSGVPEGMPLFGASLQVCLETGLGLPED